MEKSLFKNLLIYEYESEGAGHMIFRVILGMGTISPHMMFPTELRSQFEKINAKCLLYAGFCDGRKPANTRLYFLTCFKFFTETQKTRSKMDVYSKVMSVIVGSAFHIVPDMPEKTHHGGQLVATFLAFDLF